MELSMNKLSGKNGNIVLGKMEMEDPDFESGSTHLAHALFQNPKTASFDYTAEVYLGKVPGDKAATSGAKSFSIAAGASKTVDFLVNMPALTIPTDNYHVYVDVSHLGVLLITFVASDDIAVFVTPAIIVTQITWD